MSQIEILTSAIADNTQSVKDLTSAVDSAIAVIDSGGSASDAQLLALIEQVVLATAALTVQRDRLLEALHDGTPPPPSPDIPVITSALVAAGVAGTPFRFNVTATKSPASYSSSALPAGLNLHPTSGVISGTPSVARSTNVQVSATNAAGTGTATMGIVIR